jgi:hypothetical protein
MTDKKKQADDENRLVLSTVFDDPEFDQYATVPVIHSPHFHDSTAVADSTTTTERAKSADKKAS